MAAKKITRKEIGPDDRKLEPDFSPNKQAEAVKADIWLTQELKEAAKALQKSWSVSHEEQMAALNIRDVNLKFSDQAKRAAFYEALEKLAKLVNPNFPSTYPLTRPDPSQPANPIDGVWLNFWYKYFLTDAFDTAMQDTAATELHIIPTRAEILKQSKAYLAAYGSGFVRMDLVADENVDRSAVDSLTESLREAQSRLMKFLQLLVKCLADPEVHHVVISEDGQFKVNGVKKEFTGAALRALLALSLLRAKDDFKLEDFARLYHGGDASDARTDFDNAMKALKKMLPKITVHTPSQNHRSVLGIKVLVCGNDNEIVRRLAGFYKK